jgi:hypothetical protein
MALEEGSWRYSRRGKRQRANDTEKRSRDESLGREE